jgi:hypothetical protein
MNMKRMKRDKIVWVLAVLAVSGLAFFGGYNLGYADADEDMRLRVSTAETTANNCLIKLAGWCNNKRFRLVDCGHDLQVCICMAQREVQGSRDAPEEGL